MKKFKAEAGLKLESSVVYSSCIDKIKSNQPDLYDFRSVLVSTGWNKNDDVFEGDELWAAKESPINKKINFEHDEKDIIGHIIGCNAAYRGECIHEPVEDFDLITDGVLYTVWEDPEKQLRMNALLEEIEQGKWFVSMECLFDDFDYALAGTDNYIVKRTEESAFLTKHLRAYGGTGEYQNYKIGRVLRNLTFSGKGIVKHPANPSSIIFAFANAKEKEMRRHFISTIGMEKLEGILSFLQNENSVSEKTSVCLGKENIMSEELDKVKAELTKAQTEYAIEKQTLETKLATACAEKEGLESEKEILSNKLAEAEKNIAALQTELDSAVADKKMMEKKMKVMERKAKLVQAGLDDAEANTNAEKWVDVAEDIFDEYVKAVQKGKAEVTLETEEPKPTVADIVPVNEDTLVDAIASYFETRRNKEKK